MYEKRTACIQILMLWCIILCRMVRKIWYCNSCIWPRYVIQKSLSGKGLEILC